MEIDTRMAVAAFRWNIIGPLVVPGLSGEERRRYRRQVLQSEHFDPVHGRRRVSSGTLRRWIRAHQRAGMAGLCPRQRSDKGRLVALSEEVVQRAVELRREAPRRSVQRLVELLCDEFPEQAPRIRRSTLDRHLRARGWSRAALRTTAGPHVPFEMSYRNAMWTGDVLHGPEVTVPNRGWGRAKIFGWIDDHSRLCVHLEAYDDERLPALENSLQKGMLKFGLPERLFVDNALIFSSVQLDLACADLGIIKVHSTPGYAPSRGKIERLFRTVRDELLCEIEVLPTLSLEELNRYLTAWVNSQYNCRRHSRTDQSPLDRWEQSDVALRTVTPLDLQRAFLLWARRKVGTTGEVKLAGNIYYADPSLAGQTVMLRYDPFDLGQIWLWREGEALRAITPTRLVTRVMKRPEKAVEQKQSRAARRYLQSLSDTYQQQLAREMHLIRFTDVPVDQEDEEAN